MEDDEIMKTNKLGKVFASVLMGLATLGVYAQDIMVTQDGDVKTVYVVDIGSTSVFYKTSNTDNAGIQSISKAQIFVLKHADGTKYDLGSTATQAATSAAQTTPETPATLNAPDTHEGVIPASVEVEDAVSEEAKRLNQELIARINNAEPKYIGEEKDRGVKTTKWIFFLLGIGENSTLVNDEVEIAMEIGYIPMYDETGRYNKKGLYSSGVSEWNHAFSVTVKNKTAQTLYIDLGNTFFVRGEMATAYYVPSATSTASTASSGVSVNAGSVAGVLGIGGTVGKLANGINVGGGSSSATVNVTYSQRVIAIPPKSSKILDYKYMFDGYSCKGFHVYKWDNKYVPFATYVNLQDSRGKGYKYKQMEKHEFSQSNAPMKFSFFVTYSHTEDCAVTKSMAVDMFVRGMIGGSLDEKGCLGFGTRRKDARGDAFPLP